MSYNDLLMKEIISKRDDSRVENFSITIGELVNMYKNNEIILDPKFQRLFRWKRDQKSFLIESILLGLPLPSLFFSEKKTGEWEILDGLQRISTILEFFGLIEDEDKKSSIEDGIIKTDYSKLDNLEELNIETLDKTNELFLKRYKLNLYLIKKESKPEIKLDVFLRLNTGASTLSNQEVRNCIIIQQDESFYDKLELMSSNPKFLNTISILSDFSIKKRLDMELVLRFLSFLNTDKNERFTSINKFIKEKMLLYFENSALQNKHEKVFIKTFNILNELGGEDTFRRYDFEKKKYSGPIIYPAFDFITGGIGRNILNGKNLNKVILKEKINSLWLDGSFFNEEINIKISSGEKLKKSIERSEDYFTQT